jgi:tRNA-uridine 2-sulfurtransferase
MTPLRSDRPSRVLVALSGGVDSAMAAWLLKRKGRDVRGVHFLLPGDEATQAGRTDGVKAVSDHLEIPLEIVDIRSAFEEQVVEPFVETYCEGLTPNPCVRCNALVKFEYLARVADRLDIFFIATGHYARLEERSDRPGKSLLRGSDPGKDQSYFLHRLDREHLERAVFPLGNLTKVQVRIWAKEQGMPSCGAPESQEICFLPKNDYRRFIEKREGRGVKPKGLIIDEAGTVLGKHLGAHRYTIGQRRGLEIASSRPYYVKELRPVHNEVVVARKEALYSRKVKAEGFKWVGNVPHQGMRVAAQIRYRHKAAPGILEIISPEKVRFVFHEPQWAVTPGQALVCYEGDRVLGGGWICKPDEKDL